jgi:uncharacterized membrane protein
MSKLYVVWIVIGAILGMALFIFSPALSQFQLAFACVVIVIVFVVSVNIYGESKSEHNKRLDVQDEINKENREHSRTDGKDW